MTDTAATLPVDDHGGWPTLLAELAAGRDIAPAAAHAALATILAGEATEAQMAVFMTAMRMKGESVPELVAMVDAMLAEAAPLHVADDVIDIVGMGGAVHRQRHALNVSTMACFVAAGAGAKVCKHGSVRASSTSGSFDFLERLGIGIELDGAGVARCVEEAGVGFAFAKRFHPAMRFAGPSRSQLGIPTLFNVLGPLSHPGGVLRQVVGVSDPTLLTKVTGVLAERGAPRAMVVHGDGLDELTTTGVNTIHWVEDGWTREAVLDPAAELGISRVTTDDIVGGDPDDNVAIARALFDGSERGPRRDIVVLNAAAGLWVGGVVDSLADGVDAAHAALDDGRAAAALEAVRRLSADG